MAADLSRFGRMPREDAQVLARRVHSRIVENARRGGDRYDPLRQVLGTAMFGGPGANRAEYDERLSQVLARMGEGLTPANASAFFANGAAMRCAELFRESLAACDALIAAASRERAELPFIRPDDGASLQGDLVAAGMPAAHASELARSLATALGSVPSSLDGTPRGQGLARLLAACPGGLPDRELQIRAWHMGPTSGIARCIGRATGREGRTAPATLQAALGLSADVALTFLRWSHDQPLRATPRPPTRDELLSQATGHYRAGRFAEAARAYEQALVQDPGHGPAHQGLAISRMRAGDARGAADAYRSAARLSPRSAAVQVGLARALSQLGDREGAIAAYRMALSLEPSHADASRELAQAQRAVAQAHEPQATPPAGGPGDAQLRQQARAHYAARRFAEAEQAYRQLAAAAPSDAGLHAGLGASLLALSRPAEAAAAYRRATELDARNAGFFVATGTALEAAGEAAQARAAYQRALALDANQRSARDALARLDAAASRPPPPRGGPGSTTLASSLPARPSSVPTQPEEAGPALPETPSRDDIVRTMAPFEQRLETCAPAVDATVTFRLRVGGADGRVLEVETLGFLARTPEASCMEVHLSGARFPRFTRAELEVRYPMALRGAEAGEAEQEPPPPVE